jgi:hypothetical protein
MRRRWRRWPVGGRRRFETGHGPPLPPTPSHGPAASCGAHRRGRTSLFRAVCTGAAQCGFLCTMVIERWAERWVLRHGPHSGAHCYKVRLPPRAAAAATQRDRAAASGWTRRLSATELLGTTTEQCISPLPTGSQAAAIYTMGHTAEGPDSNGKTPATAGRREEKRTTRAAERRGQPRRERAVRPSCVIAVRRERWTQAAGRRRGRPADRR